MGIQKKVTIALKAAMKAKEPLRLSTLRLINVAIKDREIAARATAAEGADIVIPEADVMQILSKMVKQRQESARVYEEGGRLELAEREREEISVIEEFLPKPLSDDEVTAAIDTAISDTGAETLRDMGKVMGALKAGYMGRMDFGAVGALVRGRLGA